MSEILTPIIVAVHLMIALALIGIVLIQRSEGGLGNLGGGGAGSMGGLMSGRGTANLLTRTTRYLAAAFFLTSLALAWFATHRAAPDSIATTPPAASAPAAPAEETVPAEPTGISETTPPAAPATNEPTVPTGQ
ncbi:MAG: preprotein translocase subunit SecG [Dongiaceae bacterium]